MTYICIITFTRIVCSLVQILCIHYEHRNVILLSVQLCVRTTFVAIHAYISVYTYYKIHVCVVSRYSV